MVIESFSNPKYKRLKGLARSRNRKKEGVFLMEGREELDLAFRLGFYPKEVYYSTAYVSESELASMSLPDACDVIALSKALFDSLAYQQVPHNFLAVMPAFDHGLDDLHQHDLCIVLERVEKPGNLGAILRTCDALGVKKLILTETEIDLFNPNVIRNSRGAIFTVSFAQTSNELLRERFMEEGRRTVATALTDRAVPYASLDRTKPTALIFGSESRGLSEFWMEHADHITIIPMQGAVDSLNVSVSVGIVAAYWLMGVE